jgi:anti-sigma regulatory factor (Ser/Thr protein kinase)
LRADMPSTLAAIEEFIRRFRLCQGNIREKSAFAEELLLREALTNAAVHGNRGVSDRYVHCVVRRKPGRLVIAVWDDGSGFSWRDVLGSSAAPSVPGGRGIAIYQHYATSVRFSSRGNGLTLIRRF